MNPAFIIYTYQKTDLGEACHAYGLYADKGVADTEADKMRASNAPLNNGFGAMVLQVEAVE